MDKVSNWKPILLHMPPKIIFGKNDYVLEAATKKAGQFSVFCHLINRAHQTHSRQMLSVIGRTVYRQLQRTLFIYSRHVYFMELLLKMAKSTVSLHNAVQGRFGTARALQCRAGHLACTAQWRAVDVLKLPAL